MFNMIMQSELLGPYITSQGCSAHEPEDEVQVQGWSVCLCYLCPCCRVNRKPNELLNKIQNKCKISIECMQRSNVLCVYHIYFA